MTKNNGIGIIKKFLSEHGSVIVFTLYCVFLFFIMCVHEPWFDEAESWLIARDNSIYEMIFVRPHYEGHPPLWWLLLAIPAKLGVPYEIGLKTVQALFAVTYTFLILYKSKFPLLIKYLLPFTYFLFYQHGVMARPYGMMTLAIILCAITWGKRNKMSVLFCGSLAFLCLTSAYGIFIAGGIAIAWVLELIIERQLFTDYTRIASMVLLLLLALFLIFIMWPKSDTYATVTFGESTEKAFFKTLLYFFTLVPSEALVTSYMPDGALKDFVPSISGFILMIAVSITVWVAVIIYGRKTHTLLCFVIPYILLAMFGSAKYFSVHHIGVVFLLLLFFAWINVEKEVIFIFRNLTIIKKMCSIAILIPIICNLSWTLTCCATDIKMPYALGRDLAAYIRENNLEKKTWVTTWQQIRDDETGELISENTHQYAQVAVETNAYFDSNLLGENFGECSYLDHRIPTSEEIQKDYDLLKSEHIDYMIGKIDGDTWDKLGLGNMFRMDRIITIDRIWKTHHLVADLFILRNDG